MKASRLMLVGIIAVAMAARVGADDKADTAKLIVGKWKLSKIVIKEPGHASLPVGTTYEFTKDGKVTITGTEKKLKPSTDKYTIKGDQITFDMVPVIVPEDATSIKSVTDKKLVLALGTKGDKLEFDRLP